MIKTRPPDLNRKTRRAPGALFQSLAAATGLWMAWVLLNYDRRFPVSSEFFFQWLEDLSGGVGPGLLSILWLDIKTIALFFLILFTAAAWGPLALPKDLSGESSPLERMVLSTAAGYVILSLLIFVLGIPGGLYSPSVLGGTLLALAASGAWLTRRELTEWLEATRALLRKGGRIFTAPSHILLAFLLGTDLLMCFVPELFYDSLVYHLGLPQLYVNVHALVDTPNVYFSRFPMLIHMLYIPAVTLGGDSLAKLIDASLVFLGLGGIHALARRLKCPQAGPWAALIFLALPVVQMNIWSTAIDGAMSAYFVLATLAFVIWKGQSRPADRWVLLCAGLAGAVFAVKYNGVVGTAAVAAVLFGQARGRSKAVWIRQVFLFGAVVLFVMAPWLIRNAVWTGNPTYPILHKFFASRHIKADAVEGEQNLIKGYTPHTMGDVLELPWTLTMKDINSFDFIGPLILAALPLLLFLNWRKDDFLDTALVAGTYFIFSLLFTREIRYLLPGFFLLSLPLAMGLEEVKRQHPAWGQMLHIGCLILVGYQMLWIFEILQNSYRPAAVITGQESCLAYRSRYHPGLNPWPWNTLEPAINELPSFSRIYFLGDEKVFGCPRAFVYSSVHDYTPLVLWTNESRSAEELYAKFRSQGLTHLLFNFPEAERLKGYHLFEWTPEGRQIFLDFFRKHGRLIIYKPVDSALAAVFLFEIVDRLKPNEKPFPIEAFAGTLNLAPHAKP